MAVRDVLEPFLPVPVVARDGDAFRLEYDRPKTIGKVRGYYGPFGVFVRSYAFIRMYGPRLREMSEAAVLNANYLLARLKDVYDLPFDRLCMHEFVLSARSLKRARRHRLYVAKRSGLRLPPTDDHSADRSRAPHGRPTEGGQLAWIVRRGDLGSSVGGREPTRARGPHKARETLDRWKGQARDRETASRLIPTFPLAVEGEALEAQKGA